MLVNETGRTIRLYNNVHLLAIPSNAHQPTFLPSVGLRFLGEWSLFLELGKYRDASTQYKEKAVWQGKGETQVQQGHIQADILSSKTQATQN